jgi:hypothetical protein
MTLHVYYIGYRYTKVNYIFANTHSCPPRAFLPALCRIFLDETATESVLEVTARALTYYLDVSAECTRRIVSVDGAVKAICNRLVVAEISSRTSKDLAEQCIKVVIKLDRTIYSYSSTHRGKYD